MPALNLANWWVVVTCHSAAKLRRLIGNTTIPAQTVKLGALDPPTARALFIDRVATKGIKKTVVDTPPTELEGLLDKYLQRHPYATAWAGRLYSMQVGDGAAISVPDFFHEVLRGHGGELYGHADGAVERSYSHGLLALFNLCLLYTSPSPRDRTRSRMPSSA